MKQVLAVVLAVVMLASFSGVALADKPGGWDGGDYTVYNGNGAPSGKHYNLNIIGVENSKSNPMLTGNGHTIFVDLKGRATIYLINSADENYPGYDDCDGKDFKVVDHNATAGGGRDATFCLPPPTESGNNDDCPDEWTEYEWSVWARALGGNNGGKSFMTTCLEEKVTGDVYCSSITLKLEKQNPPKFQDVSKYLLFIYTDIGDGFKRYPIFDPAGKGYWWDYVNDGMRLVQLRFYQVPTCIPPADQIPYATANETCLALDDTTTVNITGFQSANFTGTVKLDAYDCEGKDVGATKGVVATNGSWMLVELETYADTCWEKERPITLFITTDDNWTLRVDFGLVGVGPGPCK